MPHKYAGKFIPYSKNNLSEKIPQIVYKCQQLKELSKQGQLRLKWMIYYYQYNRKSLTSRYYGISRKTFYISQATWQILPAMIYAG